MSLSPWTNFGKGIITVAPDPADSGLSFAMSEADAALFPDPDTDGAFNVIVFPAVGQPSADNAEVVGVTASAAPSGGNVVFTIVRAQEDSTAREIVVGDRVYLGVTKGVLETIMDALSIGGVLTNPLQGMLDEDDMASNSATKGVTQQSTKAYVDNGTWLKDSLARQAIINGNFDVWQRGTTGTPVDLGSVFTADRWFDGVVDDGGTLPTLSRTRQLLTSGDIPNAFYYSRLTTNGAGTSLGVNSNHRYRQRIENGTRYLCGDGKKVTISFWARSDIANKRLGVMLTQFYGTGGSPSTAEVILNSVTPVTLTSTWTKYTYTFTTNTLASKTFGTANDDWLGIEFQVAWGTTWGNANVYPSVSAETYVGSGNIDIAQVQLCAGDVALPFMPKSFEEELRACQRYYEKSYDILVSPGTATNAGAVNFSFSAASTAQMITYVRYNTNKRILVTPVLYDMAGASGKVTRAADGKTAIVAYQSSCSFVGGTNDATSSTNMLFHWTADAEL